MPETNTGPQEASPLKTNEYSVFYASNRVEKEFEKAFKTIPAHDVEAIKKAIKEMKKDPRQSSKKIHAISVSNSLPLAQYRIRVGNYRVLYDIDDDKHRVVLLKIARRNERTYS